MCCVWRLATGRLSYLAVSVGSCELLFAFLVPMSNSKNSVEVQRFSDGHPKFWALAEKFKLKHGINGLFVVNWRQYHDMLACVLDDTELRVNQILTFGEGLWDLVKALETVHKWPVSPFVTTQELGLCQIKAIQLRKALEASDIMDNSTLAPISATTIRATRKPQANPSPNPPTRSISTPVPVPSPTPRTFFHQFAPRFNFLTLWVWRGSGEDELSFIVVLTPKSPLMPVSI